MLLSLEKRKKAFIIYKIYFICIKEYKVNRFVPLMLLIQRKAARLL